MDDTIKEIARFSEKDAKAYPIYDAMIERACEIMDKYILRNPPSFAEFAAEFNRPGDEHVLKFMILGAVADSAEYYFETDIMQGAASRPGADRHLPRSARRRHRLRQALPCHGDGHRQARSVGLSAGGDGELSPRRLKRVAQELGVDIRTGKEVDHICVQGGRATGAVTNGRRGVPLPDRALQRRPEADLSEAGRKAIPAGRVCAATSRTSRSPRR